MNNSYIKGSVREIFYKTDKGYMVGVFKVRETNDDDLKSYLNRTITFNGTFIDLIIDSDYKFYGEVFNHPKYGPQFKVSYYEKMMPEERNSVISFLSSGIFPKVGIKTATKIVEKLGDNALDLILEDYTNLLIIPSIKEPKAKMIHDILYNEQQSYKTVVFLQDLGFSMSESVKIYETYKEKTIDILEDNMYDLLDKIKGIGFLTVDRIALKQMDKTDERRINAGIIYSMNEVCMETGNTYLTFDEILIKTSYILKIKLTSEELEYYVLKLNKLNKIVIIDNKYILKKMYDLETFITAKIAKLSSAECLEIKGLDGVISELENTFLIKYNNEQLSAIKASLENKFTIITGGPGTGKTTIIKGIVEAYKEIKRIDENKLLEEMVLLAPTGRAARRITESTGFRAVTIHKFLKWDKETDTFQVNKNSKSHAKMVIIDESSMMDLFIFSSLLDGLLDDVTIVMVGDYNQLPSVLPGEILKDLIDSGTTNVVRLNELYRQKENSYIVNLANDVKNSQISDNFYAKRDDYNFIECSKESIEPIVSTLCKKAIEKGYNYSQIQVLVPMYRGVNGIDNLNNKLQEIFNPKSDNKDEYEANGVVFREGDKVLQTKNLNDLEISNGDMGIIDSITKTDTDVIAIINFDGIIVEFHKKNFDDLKLGYAISIHKSQGSEFDIVIMPIDSSFKRMLYRNLIYTGITRAKKSLTLVGEKEAFLYGISKTVEKRHTLLCDNLKDSISF